MLRWEEITPSTHIEYKNFLTVRYPSLTDQIIAINQTETAETTLYRMDRNRIAHQNAYIRQIYQLLPALTPVLDNDLQTPVVIPQRMSQFARDLFKEKTGVFYTRARLEEGLVFSDDLASQLLTGIENDLFWHSYYLWQTFKVSLVPRERDSPGIMFHWSAHCRDYDEPAEVVYRVNNQNIRFDRRCWSNNFGPDFLSLAPVSSEDNDFLISEFAEREWVELETWEYGIDRVNSVRFWTEGFNETLAAAADTSQN